MLANIRHVVYVLLQLGQNAEFLGGNMVYQLSDLQLKAWGWKESFYFFGPFPICFKFFSKLKQPLCVV